MLSDIDYMNRALDLAERGRGTTSPNPTVGAVIVRLDGTIVGQGDTEPAGGRPAGDGAAGRRPAQIRRSARSSCALTARLWGRGTRSRPAGVTRKSARWTKPASSP